MQVVFFCFRVAAIISLCFFLASCEQRMQTVPLKECNSEIASDAIKEVTDKAQIICQAKANMALTDKRLAYDLWSLEHRSYVLLLQNVYTSITLALVIIVLVAGLIFAAIEFRQGKDSENTIKIGANGVEVSSKFIGIVVLALSLGFAYLFLDKAYPVNEVQTTAAATK